MVDVTNILIDKQDNFEIIRDQIAQIIADESANQMTLATDAAKDPELWELRVFAERSNPFEQFMNDPVQNTSPIVNVWFDNYNVDLGSSDVVQRQTARGNFNIDCYGYGLSEDDGATGHIPGDELAALEAQRAVRLVRNIMMLDINTYLQLRGIVQTRMPQNISTFQPQFNGQPAVQVVGARISLNVRFDEYSPQFTNDTLDELGVTITRASDGQILAKQELI